MADNKTYKDGAGTNFTAALAEFADGSFGPKSVIVDGTGANEAPVDATNGLKVDVAANGVIGEVQATPTANTVLARLKDIDDAISSAASTSIPAGENMIGQVVGVADIVSADLTRPADTTTYASGDLVSNSTTAASCTALSWTGLRAAGKTGIIRRARCFKTSPTVSTGIFYLHLFTTDPFGTAPTNGDNGAIELVGILKSEYVGTIKFDFTAATTHDIFSSEAACIGTPEVGSDITFELPTGTTLYGVVAAGDAYVPESAEVFTFDLEIHQN